MGNGMGERVGIVLVNYNGGRFLPDCLGSLARSDYPDVLVVLVDNASSDGSADWVAAHHPEVLLLRQADNGGFAQASNAGIRACLAHGCGYVLLLNNDTTVAPDFLTQLMGHAGESRLLAPKIYFADAPGVINNHFGTFDLWRGVHRDWYHGRHDTPASLRAQRGGMANGCALLVPKGIIERAGLLDEIFFMYTEDVDFILRAVQAGAEVWLAPQAVIHHRESASSGGGGSPLVVYYTTRNRLFLMARHQKNLLIRLFFLFYFFLTRVPVLLNYLRRGRRAQARALVSGIADYGRGRMGRAAPSRYGL